MSVAVCGSLLSVLLFLIHPRGMSGEWAALQTEHYDFSLSPASLQNIWEEQTSAVLLTACINTSSWITNHTIFSARASLSDASSAICDLGAESSREIHLSEESSNEYPNCTDTQLTTSLHGNFSVRCRRFGRAHVRLELCVKNDSHPSFRCLSPPNTPTVYQISAIRQPALIDEIFYYIIIFFLVLNNFLFGCSFKPEVAKQAFMRPVAPVIGLFFQLFLLCPMAYAIVYIFNLHSSIAFGMVAHAASPGGGQSNSWTKLLGGNLTLSICMSLCSTLFALGTEPLWLLTLGRLLLPESIFLPIGQIFLSLALLVVPLVFGLLLFHFSPKRSISASRAAQPAAAVYTVLLLTLGVYTYRYVFPLLLSSWRTVLAAVTLPYTAMLVAMAVGAMCRQSWPCVLTLAVEVGIQNATVTLIVLRNTLGQPEADMASVAPVACLLLTPIPMVIGVIVRIAYRGYKKFKGEERTEDASPSNEVALGELHGEK